MIAYINNQPEIFQNSWEQSIFDFVLLINKIPRYKAIFEKMIMGSVISSYFNVHIEEIQTKKTFLLDTNFIISLLDLHSDDSRITTETIIKLSNEAGYNAEVLPETIEEIKNLLDRKAREISKITLFSSQRPHTIEAGCARKKMTGQDLLVYADRIESFIENKGIKIVSREENESLFKKVKETEIYKNLIDRPFNKEGVIHDAMAMNYIKNIRTTNARDFSEINAFFVTDTSGFLENKINTSTKLPYIIRAEELVNILWLSNPLFDATVLVSNTARLLTLYLDKKLPNKEMLARIDNKIENFKDFGLDEKACVNLAMNLAETDTQKLTKLIEINEEETFKDKLIELAEEVKKAKEIKDDKQDKEFGKLIAYLEEENKLNLKEAIEARENDLNNMNSRHNDALRNREKEYNLELIKRDNERISEINIEIQEIENIVRKRTHRIFSFFISVVIIGIITITLTKVIPNWNIFEPIIWAIGLMPLLVSSIIYIIIGRTIKLKEALKNISARINNDFMIKLERKKAERVEIERRCKELFDKNNSIID